MGCPVERTKTIKGYLELLQALEAARAAADKCAENAMEAGDSEAANIASDLHRQICEVMDESHALKGDD